MPLEQRRRQSKESIVMSNKPKVDALKVLSFTKLNSLQRKVIFVLNICLCRGADSSFSNNEFIVCPFKGSPSGIWGAEPPAAEGLRKPSVAAKIWLFFY